MSLLARKSLCLSSLTLCFSVPYTCSLNRNVGFSLHSTTLCFKALADLLQHLISTWTNLTAKLWHIIIEIMDHVYKGFKGTLWHCAVPQALKQPRLLSAFVFKVTFMLVFFHGKDNSSTVENILEDFIWRSNGSYVFWCTMVHLVLVRLDLAGIYFQSFTV